MAYIKVNHQQLKKAVVAAEDYISKRKAKITRIENVVIELGSSWSGKDYDQIKAQCQDMMSANSTSDKLVKTMENYAEALKFACNGYREAQERAVNRANLLCR